MSYLGKKGPVPKSIKREKKTKLKGYKEMTSAKADKRENTLWKWFSLFIRLRDCPDNSQGFCRCKTCGKVDRYKNMDAGHFISRRWKPTKYREDNVFAQCVHCNRDLSGNLDEYAKVLGSEKVAELKMESRKPAKKMPLYQVESMIAEYRQKAKDEAFRVGVEVK